VPRPAGTPLARYVLDVALDRATHLRPVARARERWKARGAPEPGVGPDGLPVPPAALRVLVAANADPEWFLNPDGAGVTQIRHLLGDELRGSVLDFGCGCGRALRHFAGDGLELHGCDYNPSLVDWCRTNLPFAEVTVNAAQPPSPYPEARFDVLYAVSILTHLTTEQVTAWMREWRRIVKPGGLIAFSTHGDAYRDRLGRDDRGRYDAGQPVVVKPRIAGLNACSAHHPREWVTSELLAGLELVAFEPGAGDTFAQDMYVVRAPLRG
jgi:SAM-dependent methyltransferase